MIRAMVQRVQELLIFLFLALFSKANGVNKPSHWGVLRDRNRPMQPVVADSAAYCLSWRLGVEANNVRMWRTVPPQCLRHIEAYMVGGQYESDVKLVADEVLGFATGISVGDDGMDAWVFDVDDTCISNVLYYRGRRYGCDPYDPSRFKAWAVRGVCQAIPGMLEMFNKLMEMGFKIFLITGRDEETLGQPTMTNLHDQGFIGYHKLILRTEAYKGQSAVAYKSDIRREITRQGFRIWGNVGDQWSDLQGDFLGNRTFKIPNPMYFVP